MDGWTDCRFIFINGDLAVIIIVVFFAAVLARGEKLGGRASDRERCWIRFLLSFLHLPPSSHSSTLKQKQNPREVSVASRGLSKIGVEEVKAVEVWNGG